MVLNRRNIGPEFLPLGGRHAGIVLECLVGFIENVLTLYLFTLLYDVDHHDSVIFLLCMVCVCNR